MATQEFSTEAQELRFLSLPGLEVPSSRLSCQLMTVYLLEPTAIISLISPSSLGATL